MNMSQLHLICKNLTLAELSRQSQLILAKDQLLLIADATLMLTQKELITFIQSLDNTCYILEADVRCRGLSEYAKSDLQIINDQQMVDLCANSQKVISW
ncbi:sulfurtransferase complex subunit TusB [Aliikangiella maris]|uniref:Sulfurtransferase complex subunit TusB n=2 Tax=Aliikangiella maris TaxID=3162458 RepID=A0ABV3MUG3_9GAMM